MFIGEYLDLKTILRYYPIILIHKRTDMPPKWRLHACETTDQWSVSLTAARGEGRGIIAIQDRSLLASVHFRG